jgi:tRNA 2-selenouridine synthase
MSLNTLPATEVIQRLHEFDTVIDARSEDEYAQDHLPSAVNWPTLNNQERHDIGTLYKQVNPFEARKRGAAMAARNIAAHIERELLDTPKDWKPLTYCWRGGQRSGSLSLILSQIGFRVTLVEGGYKAIGALSAARQAQAKPGYCKPWPPKVPKSLTWRHWPITAARCWAPFRGWRNPRRNGLTL